jgi:hypothetical protein
MRIIHVTSDQTENGKPPLSVTIRKILSEGFGWQAEAEAREQVAVHLGNALGSEFTLLRGVVLPALDTPVPMVLIGPPGVFVVFVSALRGTFRARGDVWLTLDASGNMHPAKPNLPTRARLFAEAIRKVLVQHKIAINEVESILVFSRNDAFVENIKAPIRIVLADGIENYASGLRLSQPALTPDQTSAIVRLLAGSKDRPAEEDNDNPDAGILAQAVVMPSGFIETTSPIPQAEPQYREIFTDQSMSRQIGISEEPAPEEDALPTEGRIAMILRQTHLTKRQALFLAVFTILDSCVIIVLASLAIYLVRSQ